jgi:glutathionyl-hydroquinone reductase
MPLRYNSSDCPVCHAEQRLQRQRSSAKAEQCATVCGQRAQSQSRRQKVHLIVNSDCPVHHRTVRWPHLSELQRSNPIGWVTWLAHRTVSDGAPDYPVHPSTAAFPNGHFGGWGYKYPPNHHTSRHPSFQPTHSIQELVHSIQDTIRVNQNLSKSQFHSKH